MTEPFFTVFKGEKSEKLIPNIFNCDKAVWDSMIPGQKEHYNEFRRNCYYEHIMPGGVSITTDLYLYIIHKMAYLAATL